MSAPALSPPASPEVKGRRRPLGQPFRFASPPLPPLLDSASAPPALDDMSFLSLDDSQSFLTECGSVSSLKSYPHNLWATPSHSDYPITSEKMASGLTCGGLIGVKSKSGGGASLWRRSAERCA